MYLLVLSTLFYIATNVVRSDEVCATQISDFLQCMANDNEKKLGNFAKEVSPEIKQSVQDCFTKSGCEKPDFSQATLSYFLTEPWLSRASDIFDLLENIDPVVKDCMMRYFLNVVRSKINDCIKQDQSSDVKDFEMPPLPDVHNIDITKIKEIVLNRLVVRASVTKCNESKGEEVAKDTVHCITQARQQYDQTLCSTRVACRDQNITDQQCRSRFDKVHGPVCDCVTSEGDAAGNAGQLLLSGRLRSEFQKCHEDHNITYPRDKVEKVHQDVKQSATDILSRRQKIPPEVKQTLDLAKQALSDMESAWKGSFCAECDQKSEPEATV